MKKKAAAICGVSAALGAAIITPNVLGYHGEGDSMTAFYLAFAINSLISTGLSMYLESQREKPCIQNIALAMLLNVAGIGGGVYELLVDKEYV